MQDKKTSEHDLVRELENQIGSILDFSIYHEGNAVAVVGTELTSKLVNSIKKLDPKKLHCSREDVSIRSADEEVESFIDANIRGRADEITQEAGIAEVLSAEVREMATRKVEEFFDSCRYQADLDLDAVADVATGLLTKVANLQTTAFKITELRDYDRYTYFHCVNTCVLASVLYRDYITSKDELLELGIGMLLHDIGKSKIQQKLLTFPGKLTDEEYAELQKHPVYGYEFIKDNDELSLIAKTIVKNHHERIDGSGYPKGLLESRLTVFDMIAGICDTCDAITTDRAYSEKQDVHQAVSILIRSSGTLFNTRLVNHFLRGIGRFPVGTFVLLSSKEIGIVQRIKPDAIALPDVRILYDETGSKTDHSRIVDLQTEKDVYIKRALDVASKPSSYEDLTGIPNA